MSIETERLLLRAYQPQDFESFWALLNDAEAKRFTGGVTLMSKEQRRELFLQDIAVPFSAEGAELAVVEKSTGRWIGYCGFRAAEELPWPEFFYGFCRDVWGRGYGTEAAGACLEWQFAVFRNDGYAATVHKENTASVHLLERFRFSAQGTLEQDGERLMLYALTRDRWNMKNVVTPERA